MRHICFDWLTLRDFKSFRGTHKFCLTGEGVGLHMLQGVNEHDKNLGSNGAGKSSLWDALSWVLYRRTVAGLRANAVSSWRSDAGAQVKLRLRVDDVKHILVRSTKPNALLLDGEEVSDEDVVRVVGISWEVFRHTVVLGQAQPLFFDLSPALKIAMLSDVLGLHRWQQRSDFAKVQHESLTQLQDGQAMRLSYAKMNLKQVREGYKLLKQQEQEWRADKSSRTAEFHDKLKTVTYNLSKLSADLNAIEVDHDLKSAELASIKRDLLKAEASFSDASVLEASKLAKLRALRRRRDELRKDIDAIDTSGNCPLCDKPLHSNSVRKKLRAELHDVVARIVVAKKKLPSLDAQKTAVTSLRNAQKKFNDEVQELQFKIEDLRTRKADLEGQKSNLTRAIKMTDAEARPFGKQLQKARTAITEHKRSIAQLEQAHAKVSARAARYKWWIKGFKDVRHYVLGDVLNELQVLSDQLLAEFGLVGWSLKYDVERETASGSVQRGLNVSVFSQSNDKPVRWEAWSGGEAQRLRLIGSLALSHVLLNRAGVSFNIEALDEPTRHMSVEGVRMMCELLKDRAKAHRKTIWYVDHQSVDSLAFKASVSIVKTKEGSRVRQNV